MIPDIKLKHKSECLADARRAFMRVVNHYAVPLGLPDRTKCIHQHFHFVEAKRWSYYLRYIARFNALNEHASSVEAVTHSYGSDPKIGVNKIYHTFGTLVHESVHFFSHYAFRQAFDVNKYEGATEYLARNVLNDFGSRYDVNGEHDMYAAEVIPFISIVESDKTLELLCNAYFLGDVKSMSRLLEMLAYEPTKDWPELIGKTADC